MAQFQQVINREAQLKAVLDGYEQVIDKTNWLMEAFQKDGIQNSWGARTSAKGSGWSCTIVVKNKTKHSPTMVILEDSGTHGLTGKIPQNEREEVEILQSRDQNDRLGRFLSSDWSERTELSLGSRGRGKMIFVGSSKDAKMYFDSVRADDGKYIFGSTFLDENKTIQVSVEEGSEAHKIRKRMLGEDLEAIDHPGTRIIVPNPVEELILPILDGSINETIQETWWEILFKQNAVIYVGPFNDPVQVEKSPWLPVSSSGIREHKVYDDEIEVADGLKIKRISLGYLKDKTVPASYEGVTIQRGAMKVQTRKISDYSNDLPASVIYGSVEFEAPLDDAMLELEGAEHYTYTWNKGVASKVNREIKLKILEFAKEYKIIEDDKHSTRQQRDAELAIQRELNQLAKSMGLSGSEFGTKGKRKKVIDPKDPEQIRVSIPEFSTPTDSRRVELGQKITGATAIAYSAYEQPLKVHLQINVFREGGLQIYGLLDEKEVSIGSNESTPQVGWGEIDIDDRFQRGHYILRAKLIALENMTYEDRKIEKGDILYREVSMDFWVAEEPPAKGFFKIRSSERGNDKYIWWSEEDDGYYLLWNRLHPELKAEADDQELLMDALRKEGLLALWSIVLINANNDLSGTTGKLNQALAEIIGQPIERQLEWILSKRSESLWG